MGGRDTKERIGKGSPEKEWKLGRDAERGERKENIDRDGKIPQA